MADPKRKYPLEMAVPGATRAFDELRRTEDEMRDHQHGQLTDNQTADLEARLDDMAAQIHWAHEEAFVKPW